MDYLKTQNFLAFSLLLTLLIAGSLVVQVIGHLINIPLAPASLFIVLLPALWITYRICFPFTYQSIIIAVILGFLLAFLGILSIHMQDWTSDGISYHQPAVSALLHGWNPLGKPAEMLWQNIYPSGVWSVEASLVSLYGSIEAAKVLHIWWLFIAVPTIFVGLSHYTKIPLNYRQVFLIVLCVFSPIVLGQMLTHYVDALIYLSGLTFIGALLLLGHSDEEDKAAILLMVCCLIFIINTKLTGIYHAFMLCVCAVLFLWVKDKSIPWRLAIILCITGIFATFILGYHPYITNILKYGSLLHTDSSSFSAYQRPYNLAKLNSIERFFHSLFSVTGGKPREFAMLKWPWQLYGDEFEAAGEPDIRSSGFGPLFALGLLISALLITYAVIKKISLDKGLLIIAAALLFFSLTFPESWWLRYVPFAYAVPFLVLLRLPVQGRVIRFGIICVIIIFTTNSIIATLSAFDLYVRGAENFTEIIEKLHGKPKDSVYLVPPGSDYKIYNHAYETLERRLSEKGIQPHVRVDAPCLHKAAQYSEFKVCY
jgi:hypothetical protein